MKVKEESTMVKKKDFINCRDVLWYLVFCGFAVNYILRINLNLTIVTMVVPRPKAAAIAQCHGESLNATSNTTFVPTEEVTYEDRFAWNEYQQGLALGAYYWVHWISQLPGGLLARRYGTKLVFGLGNFLTALLGFLIPVATRYHLYALVLIRVLQGFVAGVIWPSMHDMTAKWIPPNERSRFVSAYLGSSVGAAITYPLCAAVSSSLGWEASFHVTSLLGVVWFIFWVFLVHDSPQQHPRISEEEKRYITESLAGSLEDQKTEIPWRSIFLSGPVWITIIAHWAGAWGFLTLMTQAPTYFNFIHGWNINATGILSGVPHILRMIFSYMFSAMSDWLLRTKRMSLTNVRKLATFVCTGVQGVLVLLLGFSGCHPTLAVIFVMAGTAVNGACSASTLANFVDLSPNYASILLGFCGVVVIPCGFISPAVVGYLTNNNQTIEQWRWVFVIAAANAFAGTVIYMLVGTSKEQPWNHYGRTDDEKGQEMQKLTSAQIKSDEVNQKKETPENGKILLER